MLDFLSSFVEPIVTSLAALFRADKRPEARRITIGCAVVVLLLLGVFILYVSWQRGFR